MQLQLPFAGATHAPDMEGPVVERATARFELIQFVRTPRARRYVLRVRPDGTLRVTVPRRGSRAEALRFVGRHHAWIERERLDVAARQEARRLAHGSSLLLRGSPVTIDVMETGRGATVSYDGRQIALRTGAGDLTKAVERDLRTLAQDELVPRLHELAAEQGLAVNRVTIRNQRSRWGSCSRAGAIALNYRLVQTPPAVRDYVLLHELMHLKQHNHSRRFWRLVEGVCPDFRAAERWLKSTGRTLL